jgi:pantoate kinase
VSVPESRKDFLHAGATGGGYILSRGAVSKVTALGSAQSSAIETVVNGDPRYDARTTREALHLLMKARGAKARLRVEQRVDVPIGFGFGASAASAFSAVLAASAALDFELPREEIAMFAHKAEIIQQTGFGTVSAISSGIGAGFIYRPGAPGVARFTKLKAPSGIRIVTASLAPMQLKGLLSSRRKIALVNKLGEESLRRVMAKPTLERMAAEGEWFTRKLGITIPEVASLIRLAKKAGATHASQNMIGQAMHAIVPLRRTEAVVRALSGSTLEPRVDVLEIGKVKAGVTSIAQLDYPTVTSSLA